jgi:dephospho-CoA kinase
LNTSSKENNKPLLVGITGGIGSGKTTVSKIFKALGVPVFNSDNEAKIIVNTNEYVINQIQNVFGDVYRQGKLDAVKMAELVFKDKNALERLNKIVHPKVAESFKEWVNKNNMSRILLKEAAILIETGAYKELDSIILVITPIEERIKRVVKRDNISGEKVKERIAKQLSDEEKAKHANYVINNKDGQLLMPQVLKIYEQLKSRN